MKARELIEKLEELIEKYGDLQVTYDDGSGNTSPFFVKCYNEDGNNPGDDGKDGHEFHLH